MITKTTSMIAKCAAVIAAACLVLPAGAQKVLTPEECRRMALEHNMAIRSADYRIRSAEEQKKEAFTGFFPQISGAGFTFKSNKDIVSADINTADLLPEAIASALPQPMLSLIPPTIPIGLLRDGTLAGLTAVQPVFAGGQIINGNRLAKVGLEASRIQKEQSENQVALTAEQYYWQIATLLEKQKTLAEVGRMLQALEKEAGVAVQAGVALRNDLLQVQLKANETASHQLKVANALGLCKMVLAQYIGLPDTLYTLAADADPRRMPAFPLYLLQSHEEAVKGTPEYRLLQKNAEGTTLQRKLETGKRLPAVAIGAGYAYNNLMEKDHAFGMLFATVSVPLSDWWGGSHAIRRKQLAERNAKELLADGSELLVIRMQKNRNDLEEAYKQLALARKSIEQSSENLRLNTDFYRAGTVKMSDLLLAQQQYQQANDQYADAFAAYQTKMLEYKQSAGMK